MSVTMAFLNDAPVMMSEGFRSSHTMSTMRRPQRDAMCACVASTAGMDDAPGSVSPSTSVSDIMVAAVPIVMQVPGERAMPCSISSHCSSLTLPARRSAQYLNTSVPEPSVCPRQCPRSIAPAGR